MNIFNDKEGNPSTMRLTCFVSVCSGCAILIIDTLGKAPTDNNEYAIWIIAMGIAGKFLQTCFESGRGP